MNAFAAAVATITADPNIGTDAVYRAGGIGAPVPLRVARSAPDRLGEAFGTSIVQATDVLLVAVADVADPAAGDRFVLGPDTLTVQHAEREAAGMAWRVFCQR